MIITEKEKWLLRLRKMMCVIIKASKKHGSKVQKKRVTFRGEIMWVASMFIAIFLSMLALFLVPVTENKINLSHVSREMKDWRQDYEGLKKKVEKHLEEEKKEKDREKQKNLSKKQNR